MTTTVETFDRLPGDHATYVLGDGAGAVALARASGTIAVDIETAGLGVDAWTVKAVSIGTSSHAVVLDPNDGPSRRAILDALAAATTIVAHNSSFDIPILVGTGLMRLDDVDKVSDTLIAARMAYPSEQVSKSLGAACERYLGAGYGELKSSLELGFKAVTGMSKSEMFRVLGLYSPAYVAYAGFDIVMTARLHEALPAAVARRLTDHPFGTSGDAAYLLDREQTVNRMLLRRSSQGIVVDFDVVDELKDEMRSLIADAEVQLADFGVDTSLSREKMKGDCVRLMDERGLLPTSYKRLQNGAPSADKRYLEKVNHPIVDQITTRSQAERFLTDYADKLLHLSRDGRIHPQVAVLVARTGRMSYGEPPLQQFPSSTRRMMRFDVPATSMDWSSIEPVFAANAAGDTDMLAEFEDGGDLYLPVAETAGVVRKTAKTILLAQLYGQGVISLATRLGITEDEARELVGRVMGRMPKVKAMVRKVNNVGEAHGLVPTVSGRIIPLDPDPRTGNQRFFGYTATNYFVQGSCYDLLSEAMYAMHKAGLGESLLAAVHDELVVATEAADDVQKIMLTPPPAFCELAGRVPVLRVGRTDMGHHWLPKED